ncbi:MAG TPA: hypothetical protein VMU69_28815 [Bradyrhizobium sp.]|nr:hypothetical protein [Stellaceae bacterium]HUO00227.1 hypothetical protein [Bradyrhizobium sp.]
MPLRDIVVLGLIVIVFATFGVVLGAVSWYCRASATPSSRRAAEWRADYPTDGGLVTDDD